METVNVFFGGSKDLGEERTRIKALATDLNTEFEEYQVQVVVRTYENTVEDNQNALNYLAGIADIAIFVVNDTFGDYTAEELEGALSARAKSLEKNETEKPAVYVLRQQSCEKIDPKTKQGKILSDILKSKYPVFYQDLNDLLRLARQRIIPIILKKIKKAESDIRDQALLNSANKFNERLDDAYGQKKKLTLLSAMGWCLVLCLSVLSAYFFKSNIDTNIVVQEKQQELIQEKQDQKLLLAGGGSVFNLIKTTRGVDLDTVKGCISINLPSGTACPILGEEGNRKEDFEHHKFWPILLSADKIKSEEKFSKVSPNIYTKLAILEYWLGKDPLVIYADNSWVSRNMSKYPFMKPDTTEFTLISPKQFTTLLENELSSNHTTFYATNKDSGTRENYKKALQGKKKELMNSDRIEVFHQNSNDNKIGFPNRLFFGSQFFYPIVEIEQFEAWKESNMKKYVIGTSHDNVISKDVFLYIPAYYPQGGGKIAKIPRQILDLLKLLEKDESVQESKSDFWKKIDFEKGTIEHTSSKTSFIKRDKYPQ